APMLPSICRTASSMANSAVVISAFRTSWPSRKSSQQALARVRHRPQFVEGQKPRSSFDGVNGAEDAGQSVPMLGVSLQSDQISVKTVQVLVTLGPGIL